jgi:hypothetical protein
MISDSRSDITPSEVVRWASRLAQNRSSQGRMTAREWRRLWRATLVLVIEIRRSVDDVGWVTPVLAVGAFAAALDVGVEVTRRPIQQSTAAEVRSLARELMASLIMTPETERIAVMEALRESLADLETELQEWRATRTCDRRNGISGPRPSPVRHNPGKSSSPRQHR